MVGEHERALPGAVMRLQQVVPHRRCGVTVRDSAVFSQINHLKLFREMVVRVVAGHAMHAQRVARVLLCVFLARLHGVQQRPRQRQMQRLVHIQARKEGQPKCPTAVNRSPDAFTRSKR